MIVNLTLTAHGDMTYKQVQILCFHHIHEVLTLRNLSLASSGSSCM